MTTDPLRTALTERLGLRTPIVCAPMAGAAGGRLAAAVSTAGALGMVGAGSTMSAETVTEEAAVAVAAHRPFGIGLMAWALVRDRAPLDAAIAARPALVSVSFGDYRPYVGPLQEAGIAVATQVGDVAEAVEAARAGVDLVVARGAEAGGHGRNRVATLPLLQAVLDAVDRPVLAAGGISTGRGLAAVLAAGAAGAWVGTAFLACPEGANTATARERVLDASAEDTVYTRVFDIAGQIPWPDGYGGRALRNTFADTWHDRVDDLTRDPDAAAVMRRAKTNGDYDIAPVYAGQGVGAVTQQRPAGDVVAALTDEAAALLHRQTG